MKVLIIDDDARDAQDLVGVLRGAGVSDGVAIAKTDRQAMDCLERAWGEGKGGELKLIFLDLHGPQLDGLLVLADLKSDKRWEAVPVIVVSGVNELKLVHKAYGLGAKTFFMKPLDGEEQILKTFIAQYLADRKVARDEGSEAGRAKGFCFPETGI